MKLEFTLKNETKTCYRFENKNGDDLTTLYLKKKQIEEAGIDPTKGITVKIEERRED